MDWMRRSQAEQEKKDAYKSIGANAKREIAQQIRKTTQQGLFQQPDRMNSQLVPISIVFGIAVVLSFLMVEGSLIDTTGWSPTGIYRIDRFLVGREIRDITDSAEMNLLITVFGRSIIFFLLAGLIPVMASIAVQIAGKAKLSFFSASWGATLLITLTFFLGGQDLLLKLLEAINSLLPVHG